jgi:hypothetical protein
VNTRDVIIAASKHLESLPGKVFDLLSISKPASTQAAINLSKIVSKLSPLVGNLIEFNAVEFLNSQKEFRRHGKWRRQDPDFPDTVFEGTVTPTPGFEIKAWFPLATEITARFKDSQNRFTNDSIYVCLLAWLPENLIFGKPRIIGVIVVPGISVAVARDRHYHNPPDYLVIEPEDTTARTKNLQQTNTSGYKWQGSPQGFAEAEMIVTSWGPNPKAYTPTREYQERLQELRARYSYKLDTNFSKMDRIVHPEIETFKTSVMETVVSGMTIRKWGRVLRSKADRKVGDALRQQLKV